ncbi:50S ribosomal protein L6 [Candidatus Pacearchaeota archaeon]|nr:50S ribosomal protein L6 [Candidatus Pacearchaeota archaeon]
MKEEIIESIKIPEGIEVKVNGNRITASFGDKSITKKIDIKNFSIKSDGNKIVLHSGKATRSESKIMHTTKAHIKNMLNGLMSDFEYKLEVAYSHFPVSIELDTSNNKLIVKNFLGEKKNRVAKLLPEAEVSVNGNIITIKSHNKEIAGQTAANIEKATQIKNRDRRKFQDGIYVIEKPGRII